MDRIYDKITNGDRSGMRSLCMLMIFFSFITIFSLSEHIIEDSLSDRVIDPQFDFSFRIPFIYRTRIFKEHGDDWIMYKIRQTATEIKIKAGKVDKHYNLDHIEAIYWIPLRDSINGVKLLEKAQHNKDDIRGRYYEFSYKKNRRKLKTLLFYYLKGGILYTIRCDSPERLYHINKKIFLRLEQEFNLR